jgi:hypothetical protein
VFTSLPDTLLVQLITVVALPSSFFTSLEKDGFALAQENGVAGSLGCGKGGGGGLVAVPQPLQAQNTAVANLQEETNAGLCPFVNSGVHIGSFDQA